MIELRRHAWRKINKLPFLNNLCSQNLFENYLHHASKGARTVLPAHHCLPPSRTFRSPPIPLWEFEISFPGHLVKDQCCCLMYYRGDKQQTADFMRACHILHNQQKAWIYTNNPNSRNKDDIIKIMFNEVFHYQSFTLTNKTNTTLALIWTFFHFSISWTFWNLVHHYSEPPSISGWEGRSSSDKTDIRRR